MQEFIVATVLSMVLGATAATAQVPGNRPPPPQATGPALDQEPLFRSLDANGDGRVEASEFAAEGRAGTLFADMDADHDGALTLAELNASHPPASVDTNGDGAFSIDEFRAVLKQNYQSGR